MKLLDSIERDIKKGISLKATDNRFINSFRRRYYQKNKRNLVKLKPGQIMEFLKIQSLQDPFVGLTRMELKNLINKLLYDLLKQFEILGEISGSCMKKNLNRLAKKYI